VEPPRQAILTLLQEHAPEDEWTMPKLAASIGQGGLDGVERALAELEARRYLSRVPRTGRSCPCYVLAAPTRAERTA
jgi:hypothetical protein